MNQIAIRRIESELPNCLLKDVEPRVLVGIDGSHGEGKFSAGWEAAVLFGITLVEGKWRLPILRHLQGGALHFAELKRRLHPVSKKVLNQHLRQMVKDGLINRTEFIGNMPRVEYSLANPLGYAVFDMLQAVAEWGDRHSPQSDCSRNRDRNKN